MKKSEKEHSKERKFLNMPSYPGGNKALREFVNSALQYPPEALKNKVEGAVVVGYDVDHNGEVGNIHIIKSLGSGCDEEAIRIVRLLQFNPTFNRGIRVKKSLKLRIDFKLKEQGNPFKYQIVPKPESDLEHRPQEPTKITYTYSISTGPAPTPKDQGKPLLN